MKSIKILTAGLILSFTAQCVLAVGPTYVKDNIAASASWTKDNSPYVLQNDITVIKGAILTIDPGVEVQFSTPPTAKSGKEPNLVIQGGIKAVGNSTTPISFVPSVAGGYWGAIYFYTSDPANSVLQGCLIKGGHIVCNGSSPNISQCSIYGGKSGVEIAVNSSPQIINNRITANQYGLILLDATANPVISKNEIYNNNYGIYFKDFGTPTLSDNKIYNNLKYNLVNYSPKPLSMPNNDFKSTDAAAVARSIYDGASNPVYGKLTVTPFAGAVVEAAGSTVNAAANPLVSTNIPPLPTPVASTAVAVASAPQAKPVIQEEDFWSYGRPFDAMKVSNLEQGKSQSSGVVKILAVGATAVVTAVLLFL